MKQRRDSPTLIQTPYYLIDKARLLRNLECIAYLRARSGAKALLALKCFATWSLFDFMRPYMDGTTSSSLNEVRLGRTRFGGETHAYSVAWADHEIDEAVAHADKVIFNSIGQLDRFGQRADGHRPRTKAQSRHQLVKFRPRRSGATIQPPWGVGRRQGQVRSWIEINGFMIHNNCENTDFGLFSSMLDQIEAKFGELLRYVDWVSLGGGIHFTGESYPLDALCDRLRAFSERFGVQVYLEPGEAAITRCATLEMTVLDTLFNGRHLAIVDSSIEAHMLDLLIYREKPRSIPMPGRMNTWSAASHAWRATSSAPFVSPSP